VNWRDGQWSGWSVGKRGYMSMDMYGYALSLYTLERRDPFPQWASHLRPDVRAALKGVFGISNPLKISTSNQLQTVAEQRRELARPLDFLVTSKIPCCCLCSPREFGISQRGSLVAETLNRRVCKIKKA
jgi:hypothetical protein